MKKILQAVLVVGMVAMATHGFAQEATETTNTLAPVVEGFNQTVQNMPLSGEGIEAWFFSFLERLLNLFASFIGQILQQVFGGVGNLLTGTAPTTSV
jgi:hypothetical protein